MNELDDTVIAEDSGLRLAITELVESGADSFDPVRFRYIESMARRAHDQRGAVSILEENKAHKALEQYVVDFSMAREDAGRVVKRVAAQFPESAERLYALIDGCDFKGVVRLEERLGRNKDRGELADLTKQIMPDDFVLSEGTSELSFDDMLRQQESDAITEFANKNDNKMDRNWLREPKSIRLYRESWVKRSSDSLITKSINDGPETPGPLNPQGLVIRYLASMRDLSPEYVNRYISYIETLLWLEQASDSFKPGKPKKGGGKSTSKKARTRKPSV